MADEPLPPIETASSAPKTLRRRVYEIVEGAQHGDRHSALFDRFLIALILLNVAAFIAETVPSLERGYGPWFSAFEYFSVGSFSIEYVLRI